MTSSNLCTRDRKGVGWGRAAIGLDRFRMSVARCAGLGLGWGWVRGVGGWLTSCLSFTSFWNISNEKRKPFSNSNQFNTISMTTKRVLGSHGQSWQRERGRLYSIKALIMKRGTTTTTTTDTITTRLPINKKNSYRIGVFVEEEQDKVQEELNYSYGMIVNATGSLSCCQSNVKAYNILQIGARIGGHILHGTLPTGGSYIPLCILKNNNNLRTTIALWDNRVVKVEKGRQAGKALQYIFGWMGAMRRVGVVEEIGSTILIVCEQQSVSFLEFHEFQGH